MIQTTRLLNFEVSFRNTEEFRELKREVFGQDIYSFEYQQPNAEEGLSRPRIVDIGAHIGMSTLYWKYLYPEAEVIAVEPHPLAYSMLERNVTQNRLRDVETINAAVHTTNAPVKLITDADPVEQTQWLSNTSVRSGSWRGDQPTFTREISVPGIDLDTLLQDESHIDLMKVDIEGYEQAILTAASDKTMQKIQQLIIEFHPHSSQDLDTLVRTLQSKGFSVQIFHRGRSVDVQDAPETLLMLQARKI